MARPKGPSIPDDKIMYFTKQLNRELSHMFQWEGLPQTVPGDYIERVLVHHGYVLYYEDESIGQDVLKAEVSGYNRHNLPVRARTFAPTTNQEVRPQIERNIKYLSSGEDVDFNPATDGVLIMNMAYGEHCQEIVDHFARRMALAQQAFDTQLLWANVPYIFQTSSDETRLSIEKNMQEIFDGNPFIIADKELYRDNQDRTGLPTDIKFLGKEIMDTLNEIKMKFKETVGFKTAGVDKAERVNLEEVQSNDQHTKTVLQIMLEQRQRACEAINEFFNQSITVKLIGEDELEEQQEQIEEEGEEEVHGTSDSGTGTPGGED